MSETVPAEVASANVASADQSPSALQKTVLLQLSEDTIKKEVATRLQKIARTAKMPGFRPGKVPMNMIVQSHGADVHSDVLGDEINRAFSEYIKANNVRVAGLLQVAPQPGSNDLAFNFTFEVYPEVQVPSLAPLSLERYKVEITDEVIQKTIDVLRKQRATYQVVERPAQALDRVEIDFVGTLNGEKFEGGSAEKYRFVLGENRMLPEFEAAVLGMAPGQSKTFPLQFPADYGVESLNGQQTEFTVTLNQVEESVLPELTAEFIQSLGIESGQLEDLKTDVQKNIGREVKTRVNAKNRDVVFEALLNHVPFELPQSLIKEETAALMKQTRETMQGRGLKNPELMKLDEALFVPRAEKRIRLGLIVAQLTEQNNLQPKPEQLRAHIDELVESYESPDEVRQWFFQDRARLADAEFDVAMHNVTEYVFSQVQVTDKALSFDELMGK